MPDSVGDALRWILEDLASGEPAVTDVAVITADGLVIEALWQRDGHHRNVGTMSAALAALAKRATHELERGRMEQLVIRASEGCALLRPAGDAFLAVLTGRQVNLGMLLLLAGRAAEDIRTAMLE